MKGEVSSPLERMDTAAQNHRHRLYVLDSDDVDLPQTYFLSLPSNNTSVGNQKILLVEKVKLIQLGIFTYVDLSNHYSKTVKILVFVHSGFNLIWHRFCTKSTSAILLLGQETEIRTTKFCRQILAYLYEQNLIICQNPETFGILFSKYFKSLHNFYTKLRAAITKWKFGATKQWNNCTFQEYKPTL